MWALTILMAALINGMSAQSFTEDTLLAWFICLSFGIVSAIDPSGDTRVHKSNSFGFKSIHEGDLKLRTKIFGIHGGLSCLSALSIAYINSYTIGGAVDSEGKAFSTQQ